MEVYRIAKSQYVGDLKGTGARLFGGRWNRAGTPMLYSSDSRALAMLEVLVHASRTQLPMDLELITLHLPVDHLTRLDPNSIATTWRTYSRPEALQEWGSRWIQNQRELAILVPSVLVPDEDNVLVNPLHPEINKVSLVHQRKIVWDGRFS